MGWAKDHGVDTKVNPRLPGLGLKFHVTRRKHVCVRV